MATASLEVLLRSLILHRRLQAPAINSSLYLSPNQPDQPISPTLLS